MKSAILAIEASLLLLFCAATAFMVYNKPLTIPSVQGSKTSYARCVDAAEHLRSDAETKEWERAVCSRLPYEAGDLR